jgi:uncharacterized protein
MRHLSFGRGLLVALAGWLLLAPAAQAQSYGVHDEAGLFSKEARTKAVAEIERLHNTYKKDVLVETLKEGPQGNVEEFAIERARKHNVHGVYAVITENPHKLEVVAQRDVRNSGLFTNTNEREMARIMLERLRTKQLDNALLDGVRYVEETFATHAQAAGRPNTVPVAPAQPAVQANPLLGWLCMGAAVLLVVWVIVAIIRAVSGPRPGYGPGPGGPGYGAAGGYGPGYGGGGGGGFFSSMMGGLFGAAAGNWIFNNWFGGHQSSPSNFGGGAPTDAGPDYTASGGDWGNAAPPADDGGGAAGGDWGDNGGGGGDTGGDWGGGGAGGDWGGGGGDAGGGGAGGDW